MLNTICVKHGKQGAMIGLGEFLPFLFPPSFVFVFCIVNTSCRMGMMIVGKVLISCDGN